MWIPYRQHPTSSVTIKTQPALEPVTVADLALHCHSNEDDQSLAGFISAAREQFEFLSGRTCLPTVYTERFSDWACVLRLSRATVSAVESVMYFDENGDEQELENWEVDLSGTPAMVYLPDQDYPVISCKKPRPVSVEYTAGYLSASAIPASIRLAIKLLAAHYASVRESYGTVDYKEVPMGLRAICNQHNTGMGLV